MQVSDQSRKQGIASYSPCMWPRITSIIIRLNKQLCTVMGNTGSKQIKLWVSLSLKPSLHERFFSKKCEKSVRENEKGGKIH